MKDVIINEKPLMWYKVRELSGKLNKTQVGICLGIHRDTVRSYLSMNLDEFLNSNVLRKSYKKKLQPYGSFIKKDLEDFNFLSSAQILDHLKENYPDFPEVSERTVYSFVEYIRDEYKIPKTTEELPRQMMQIPCSPYGEDAQVDFGEKLMVNEQGRYVRVYFFAMVLCRSRYKFIFIQTTPFTTATTVYAHSLAFRFMGGMPKRIIYDQDKVLLKSENLGDLLLTSGFKSFTDEAGFEVTFCRKQDPQSKGKVENVVKYVKNNFLKGRKYKGVETLNDEVIGWLQRTGNGKKHAATRLVPADEFNIESTYLLPYKGSVDRPEDKLKPYIVRKDNTIAFRGCFYSLPLGSYKAAGCKALLGIEDDQLHIYEESSGKQIAQHGISPIKGILIQNTDHKRLKSESIKEMEDKVLTLFDYDVKAALYLDLLNRDKPRYYRDNLQCILIKMPNYTIQIRKDALYRCFETQAYNAKLMNEVANSLVIKENAKVPTSKDLSFHSILKSYDLKPAKRDLSTYQNAM